MLVMELPSVIQGREFSGEDLELVRRLLREHPDWSQYRLSRELAGRWDWHNAKGQLKDIACRSLLRKLSSLDLIELPPPRWPSPNRFRHRPISRVDHRTDPVTDPLAELRPIRLLHPLSRDQAELFAWFLARYHYLSFRQPVGENLRYLAVDQNERPLACLLFGSAAWKCAARDRYIGWEAACRRERLHLLTNNHRFLILPWVRVPHLASHLLGLAARRLSADWEAKYGHPILLVETFVDRDRFAGTSYRAANWQCVGATTGRSRNDRGHRLKVPVKDVYLYELRRGAREVLADGT